MKISRTGQGSETRGVEISRRQTGTALPLPLAGEGWGGGASASGFSMLREPPPAALFERVGLPRKRERRSDPADKAREHHMRLHCAWAGFVRHLKRIACCEHVAADASHLFRGKPVNILPDHA